VKSERTFIAMILFSVSLFLTKMMGVIAAFPLMPTRVVLGSKLYWALNFLAGGLLVAIGQYEWGGIFVLLTVLLGSFGEFESRGDSLQTAGVCSIIVTLIVSAGVFGVAYLAYGAELFKMIQQGYAAGFNALNAMYVEQFGEQLMDEKTLSALKMQIPSFVVMGLLVALFFGLLGEARLLRLSGLAKGKNFYQLSEFRLHDAIIWFFIASLLGSFWNHGNEPIQAVATNVLNVSVLLLFFQGLAVMSRFFEVFKVGAFWRILWTVLLVVQLSLGIILLGLTDYWLDFRKRFKQHAAAIKEGQKNNSGRK